MQRLKQTYDGLLSSFAFKINLRHYKTVEFIESRLAELDEEKDELQRYTELDRTRRSLEYTIHEKVPPLRLTATSTSRLLTAMSRCY